MKLVTKSKVMSSNAKKRKCSFTDALRAKYPGFKNGKNDYEAECITCGACVSVANGGLYF